MKKYVILIPIYNDRESLTKLIENINSVIEGINSEISVVVINDASSQQIIDDYQSTENINSLGLFRSIIVNKEGHIVSFAPPKSIDFDIFSPLSSKNNS